MVCLGKVQHTLNNNLDNTNIKCVSLFVVFIIDMPLLLEVVGTVPRRHAFDVI